MLKGLKISVLGLTTTPSKKCMNSPIVLITNHGSTSPFFLKSRLQIKVVETYIAAPSPKEILSSSCMTALTILILNHGSTSTILLTSLLSTKSRLQILWVYSLKTLYSPQKTIFWFIYDCTHITNLESW